MAAPHPQRPRRRTPPVGTSPSGAAPSDARRGPGRGAPRGARGPSGRRSHAERRAETRARLLEAVVESIAGVGFHRTTAVEIARRAGVTWGAVQHHFGDKDGILAAVLEESFGRFAERLGAIETEGRTLEARVHDFVTGAWEHFRSPHYRSMLEILLHYAPARADGGSATERMFHSADALWLRLFADAPLLRRQHRLLLHYAVSVLSGLATSLTLDGGTGLVSRRELEMLEETLLRELQGAPD